MSEAHSSTQGNSQQSVFRRAPTSNPAAPHLLPQVYASVDVTQRPIFLTSAGVDGLVRQAIPCAVLPRVSFSSPRYRPSLFLPFIPHFSSTARVWDLRRCTLALAFPSYSPIWCVATLPAHGRGAAVLDSQGGLVAPRAPLGDVLLATGHEDGLVRTWDSRRPDAPLLAFRVDHDRSPVTSMSALGDLLLTGSSSGAVGVWDAVSGLGASCAPPKPLLELSPPLQSHVSGVAWLNSSSFVSAHWDGALRLWQRP
jgi:WD40 repeat protein